MKNWLMTLVASGMLFSFGAYPAHHFLTVDENGSTVSGVRVRMSWLFEDGRLGLAEYFSDESGRFNTGTNVAAYAGIEEVEKEGYERERYLNLHEPYYSIGDNHPEERPYKMVFRKLNPEKDVVIWRGGTKHGDIIASRQKSSTPLPLWAVEWPNGKGYMPADCFAQTKFDEVKNLWMCAFWTTNANGGVLASTNRVFVAPATGYQKSIEVPLEMCSHPAFTLYVKTYDPQIYAMFYLYGYCLDSMPMGRISDRRCRCRKTNPGSEALYGGLQVEMFFLNPFGGRILEHDSEIAFRALGGAHDRPLLQELEQHRYPPRPDLPARLKNRQRQREVNDEIQKMMRWFQYETDRREEITERNASVKQTEKNSELEQLDRERKKRLVRNRELYDELRRLEAEEPKLNLPK